MSAQGRHPTDLASMEHDSELPMPQALSQPDVRQENIGMREPLSVDQDDDGPADQPADEPGPSHVIGQQEPMVTDAVTPAQPGNQAGPSQDGRERPRYRGIIMLSSDEDDDPASSMDMQTKGQAASSGETGFIHIGLSRQSHLGMCARERLGCNLCKGEMARGLLNLHADNHCSCLWHKDFADEIHVHLEFATRYS